MDVSNKMMQSALSLCVLCISVVRRASVAKPQIDNVKRSASHTRLTMMHSLPVTGGWLYYILGR